MKLIIIGWFYLISPVITAKEYFEILGYEVYFFPLLHYNLKFSGNSLYNSINSFIKNIDPNVILWWNWECSGDVIKKIKENTNNILHCLFNWDHPFCLSNWDNTQNRKITSKNIWDICFVTADYKLNEYISSGSKEVYYLRMFADDEVHFPEKDKEYECDISFVLTNLYEDKTMFSDQIFDRKTFLENIIKEKDINLKIYGPEHLKKTFPNNYYGFVHFLDNHKVFNNSKLSISITEGVSGYKYCNERVGTILSSGGLLFCDKVNGIDEILTDGHDCILIDENNYISQIKNILKNYDNYKHIKLNAVKTAKDKFSPKFWTEFIYKKIKQFIKNNHTKGINLKPNYTFENYQKDKISIVMTYFNRITQLLHTLDTIEETKYPKDLIEVICYDDRSDIEPLIIDTSKYSYNIKLIYANYEQDNKIINPSWSYNSAFKYITGEYVIIQNSECMHIGDIINYTYQNLKGVENKVISFPCWATANEKISHELFDVRFDSNKIKNIVDNKWNLLVDYPENFKGWYNERYLRPECLHFCNALHINTFKKIGLFNTKLTEILGFDDNEYSQRIMFHNNIDFEIPEHNYKLFVIHQYHGKYNKPRPSELFLNSYDKYRKISNYNKNNFLNGKFNKENKIINVKYENINKEDFIKNLKGIWSCYFVYLIIKDDVNNIDIKFLRKCLKHSNFKIKIKNN
jgi:hypothetical protein